MNFSATREEHPDKIVIRVRGDVDMATANELLAALTPDSGRPFVVDLSEATFVDSQGLNTLVRASNQGAAIVLRSPVRRCGTSLPSRGWIRSSK